jgi:hypothetical protein
MMCVLQFPHRENDGGNRTHLLGSLLGMKVSPQTALQESLQLLLLCSVLSGLQSRGADRPDRQQMLQPAECFAQPADKIEQAGLSWVIS